MADPAPERPVPDRRALAAGLLAALAAAGCACGPGGNPYRDLAVTGSIAGHHYERAKSLWARERLQPATDRARRAAANLEVVRALDAARADSDRCPLFLTKAAELLLEIDPAAAEVATARSLFRRALATCEDWVPAHLGLARLALLDGDRAAARLHVANAALAVESLEAIGGCHGGPGVVILGLRLFAPAPPDPMDPTLPRAEGHRLVMSWLLEDLQWQPTNRTLVPDDLSVEPPRVEARAGDVYRRLRARIALFDHAFAVLDPATSAEERAASTERALLFDPDYFDALLAKAMWCNRAGRFDAAYALLRPLRDSGNPLLAHHGTLCDELSMAVAERFFRSGSDRHLHDAIAHFRWLQRARGSYRDDPFLKPTQALFLALDDRDPAPLAALEASVAAWQPPDPDDRDRRQRLLRAVQAARQRVGS